MAGRADNEGDQPDLHSERTVDHVKVERIARVIAAGDYEVDADRLAAKIIENDLLRSVNPK